MTSVLTYYAKYILFDESQVTVLNLVFGAGSLIGLAFAAPLGKRFSKKTLLGTLLGIVMLSWVGCWFAFDRIALIYLSVGMRFFQASCADELQRLLRKKELFCHASSAAAPPAPTRENPHSANHSV